MDAADTMLAVDLAPRSRRTQAVTLRNWTAKPRAWKAAADQPWIAPEKTAGEAAPGFTTLKVTLDGSAVEAGRESKGTLTITDTATGLSYPVEIAVNVPPVFDVSLRTAVFNVPIGAAEERTFALMNNSGAQFRWKSETSSPWIAVKPASGVLPSEKAVPVVLACRAPAAEPGVHEAEARIVEEGRTNAWKIKVKAHVVAPYREPALPVGEPVGLDAVDRKFLKSHEILAFTSDRRSSNWMWHSDLNQPRVGPTMYLGFDAGGVDLKGWGRTFGKALWVRPHHVSVYALEGSGFKAFKAFSAWVGFPKGMNRPDFHQDAELYFEIHVDGTLRAQSGKVLVTDEPRLLAVEGLAGAREMTLVTRLSNLADSERCLVFWADPTFYK